MPTLEARDREEVAWMASLIRDLGHPAFSMTTRLQVGVTFFFTLRDFLLRRIMPPCIEAVASDDGWQAFEALEDWFATLPAEGLEDLCVLIKRVRDSIEEGEVGEETDEDGEESRRGLP